MKVLIYNWVQFDDARLAGGGVTVYLRNVIEELLRREDVTVYFLSSGKHYRAFRRKPRIVPSSNAYGHDRLKTFTLLNSPIKAPAHDAFFSIDQWREDDVCSGLIANFIREHGPFDALHIHNLEGIGTKVLTLPKGPDLARLFYTFHNYVPLCPQIELLYNGREPCLDFRDGSRCIGCLGHDNQMHDLVAWARAASVVDISGLAGHPLGGFLFDMLAAAIHLYKAVRNLVIDIRHGFATKFRHWHLRPKQGSGERLGWRKQAGTPAPKVIPLNRRAGEADAYKLWRETNAWALATQADGLFAVSDLARDTAQRLMPAGRRIETLLLPIDVDPDPASVAGLRSRRALAKDVTLSFVGYDIASKGLPFMIDALADLNDPYYRKQVNLLVVARLGAQRTRQLVQLERQFKSVRVVPSYRRDQLEDLSGLIDLNVVPSIWWETFNQVTVELGRLGVASLVSSTVGAKQTIHDHDSFVFKSGDAADFRKKLDQLVKNPNLRARYFDQPLAIPTIREHVDLLLERYASG